MAYQQSKKNKLSLFNNQGERKYLNKNECRRFVHAISVLTEQSEQAFCETVYATGCRISEALALDIMRVNIEDAYLVLQTLKKHGEEKGKHFRIVPIRRSFAKRLDEIFDVAKNQCNEFADQSRRLWRFGRQKGWVLIKKVMKAAGIFGIRATARGLRHSYGVTNILAGVPVTLLQERLGHSDLSTTAIYLNVVGVEDRSLAQRHWHYLDG